MTVSAVLGFVLLTVMNVSPSFGRATKNAKRNGSCSEYQITDTMPLPPVNVQIRPILVVDPDGVKACR